jgi:hypothetical protein
VWQIISVWQTKNQKTKQNLFLENQKGRKHFEDIEAYGRIVLKCTSRNRVRLRTELIYGYGPSARS